MELLSSLVMRRQGANDLAKPAGSGESGCGILVPRPHSLEIGKPVNGWRGGICTATGQFQSDGRPPRRADLDPPLQIPRLLPNLMLIDAVDGHFRCGWSKRNHTARPAATRPA